VLGAAALGFGRASAVGRDTRDGSASTGAARWATERRELGHGAWRGVGHGKLGRGKACVWAGFLFISFILFLFIIIHKKEHPIKWIHTKTIR
jgi:hypothetical protein